MRKETRVTTKGQIVIPKPIRDQLGWRSGTRLRIETLSDGAVRLEPASGNHRGRQGARDPIERAFGFLSAGRPVEDLEREHRQEVEADARRRRGG